MNIDIVYAHVCSPLLFAIFDLDDISELSSVTGIWYVTYIHNLFARDGIPRSKEENCKCVLRTLSYLLEYRCFSHIN